MLGHAKGERVRMKRRMRCAPKRVATMILLIYAD